MNPSNILDTLPAHPATEVFDEILRTSSVRIERIVSRGHASPVGEWYDQDENEWVMVVQGQASLEFDDGSVCALGAGDHVNIPAHVRHRVAWTDPDAITVWLAVFYR